MTLLQGEKVFYLIKPTPTNLALYEEWSSSPNQSEVFFGEKVDKCYKYVVRPGTTLFLPTGTPAPLICLLIMAAWVRGFTEAPQFTIQNQVLSGAKGNMFIVDGAPTWCLKHQRTRTKWMFPTGNSELTDGSVAIFSVLIRSYQVILGKYTS